MDSTNSEHNWEDVKKNEKLEKNEMLLKLDRKQGMAMLPALKTTNFLFWKQAKEFLKFGKALTQGIITKLITKHISIYHLHCKSSSEGSHFKQLENSPDSSIRY